MSELDWAIDDLRHIIKYLEYEGGTHGSAIATIEKVILTLEKGKQNGRV
jgi:hypothetical protein